MDAAVSEDVGTRWMAAMRAGDWEAAWQQTDRLEHPRRRAQLQPGFRPQPGHLVWDGRPLAGRSVLVRCEHGLGDTLQFLRFLPAIERHARELHLMVQPPLVELLRGAPGLGAVHNGWLGPDWPAHEVEIEVMELAYALRCTMANVPPPFPQLAAQAQARADLEVPRDGRLRIGLLWSASEWDTSRSIPLPELGRLLALDHLRFFGLQQGAAVKQAIAARLPIEPLWEKTATAEAAAAAMLQMDLVISVDGMPAHLAATLGRPTWLLLKHDADWRWMDGRDDSPWYPSMRLFRQRVPGDWRSVIEDVYAACLDLPHRPTGACGGRLPPGDAAASIVHAR
jgi:hypothetical protein